MKGWVKLHKQFLDWEWYRDPNTKALFIHLLLIANMKDQKYMGTLVPRGSWLGKVIGRKAGACDNLQSQVNLTEAELKTAMNHLKKTGEITTKTTNKFTLITIVNYDKYQDKDEKTTIKQQSNDNLTSSIEEECKEEKEKTYCACEPPENPKPTAADIEAFFERIWLRYPNKKGKGQVSDAKKQKLYGIGYAQLVRCIERYEQTKEDWKKWQHGSTFFNSGYVDYLDCNFDNGGTAMEEQVKQQILKQLEDAEKEDSFE